MSDLKINLLGPPEILLAGESFETERRKALALLAYLAVTGRPQPREHLAGFFWPDYERDSAFSYLRRELYEINNALGKGWLLTDRRTAGLDFSQPLVIDTVRFEAEIQASRSAEDPVPVLQRAAGLYRGDFLAGFFLQDTEPFEDWQRAHTEHYRRAYAEVLARLAFLHEQRGAWDEALRQARTWLAQDDLNEAAHRALLRIYAGMGDRAAAVRQYETCRAELQEELGVEPQAETTTLYERILEDRFDRPEPPRPQEGRAEGIQTVGQVHLPVLTTPFIGRRPEVEQIKEIITQPDTRLVTLLGPGGTGKTRLAIQSAGELASHFPDGVWFVPLAPVQGPDGIVPSVAGALSFTFYKEEEAPRQQLIDYLREKRLLLVLDNIEHLVQPETSDLLMAVLTQAEEIRLMVTTRVRLNTQAEKLFQVTGMRMPTVAEAAAWTDPESQSGPFSAVQLFKDRANRVQPDFRMSRENVPAVVEICQLVSGMPLGVELAASWLPLLPPEEIAAEIRHSIDFLATDQPDVPERQRSMRAVFDYSWKLLNEVERDAFLQLTVFEGTFSYHAAQQVSGGSLWIFRSLASKSWLQQAGDGRFQLHPLLRIYGLERLVADHDAWRQARSRHAAYFTEFMASQVARMRGSDQLAALNSLTEEFANNLKSAWDWLVDEGEWDLIREKFAMGLFLYGVMRWTGEAIVPWLRQARLKLEAAPYRSAPLTYAVIGTLEIHFEESWGLKDLHPEKRLSALWQFVEDNDLAEAMGFWYVLLGAMYRARNAMSGVDGRLQEAMERLRSGDDPWIYYNASLIRLENWDGLPRTNSEEVKEIKQVILPYFRQHGAVYEQAVLLRFLADNAAAERRPIDEIVELYTRAQDLFLEIKDYFGYGMMYWQWANQYFTVGQPEKGFEGYDRMLAVFNNLGNKGIVGMVLAWKALWAGRYLDFDTALKLRLTSLEYSRQHGLRINYLWDLFETGDVYRIFKRYEEAGKLYEDARVEIERMELVQAQGYLQRAYGDLAMAKGQHREAFLHYQAFLTFMVRDNHRWSVAQAHGKIAWALAHVGDTAEARVHIRSALEGLQDTPEDVLILNALLAEVRCLIEEKSFDHAAGLAAYIVRSPVAWNEIRDLGQELLVEIKPELSDEAFDTAGERYANADVRRLMADWFERHAGGAS